MSNQAHRPSRRLLRVLMPVLAVILGSAVPVPARGDAAHDTVSNPASASFADTFADPSIIQAKNGWYYESSTSSRRLHDYD